MSGFDGNCPNTEIADDAEYEPLNGPWFEIGTDPWRDDTLHCPFCTEELPHQDGDTS